MKRIRKSKVMFSAADLTGKAAVLVYISVGAIAALALLLSFTKLHVLPASLITLAVYAAAVFAAMFLMRGDKAVSSELPSPVLGNVMVNAVQKLHSPIFIVDDEMERIIWHNKATASLSPTHSITPGTKMQDIFGISRQSLGLDSDSGDGTTIRCGERTFRVAASPIKTVSRSFCLFELTEITDLEKLYSEIARKNMIFSYIIVDNLSDMLQNQQQAYRAASSEIEDILSAWARESNGILKEYDRNCYIFMFEAEKLDEFVIRKFDILDKIRDVRIGEGSISVTISMGVANLKNALPQAKEKAAQEALDMALQRGGDQVVVKSEESIEFYGGRSKTVQKRTKVRARVIANELIVHLTHASNVIIMGHKYPDFDAFGACVGIARLAMFCGVPVNIVYSPGNSDVKMCRELLDTDEYRGVFVDPETALDLVNSDTLVILADVNNLDIVESREIADSCGGNMIIIDHHRKAAEFPRQPLLTYIEPSASSACELVAEMLEQVLPLNRITVNEANILLSGILVDTKQFTKNTGTRTFSAALYLRDRGADPNEARKFFKTDLDDFMREGKFRTNVVVYRGITAIALGEGEGTKEDRIAAAKAADMLLNVEGVEASFALIKIGDTVHISARSVGTVNVQLILEELKGGGHFDAAGAQVDGLTLSGALVKLKEAIDHYIDNTPSSGTQTDITLG